LAIYFFIMSFLGKNIRYLRKQSSKTQTEFALLTNKGQTTIGNWENGLSEPSIAELLLLSNYFDISLDILLKVDLAQTNWQASPSDGARGRHPENKLYEHAEGDLSLVRDKEKNDLSYVLLEIETIRKEIERINARLSGKAGGEEE
jgi:transcriptional regulator with XRE-family HTH domain